MKQRDIKQCCQCGAGVGHCGPCFYTVQFKQHILLDDNIRRHGGLEQMLGSPALASVMGIDADISRKMTDTGELWIFQDCAMETSVLCLLEHAQVEENDG